MTHIYDSYYNSFSIATYKLVQTSLSDGLRAGTSGSKVSLVFVPGSPFKTSFYRHSRHIFNYTINRTFVNWEFDEMFD